MLTVKGNCISAPVKKENRVLHTLAEVNDLARSIKPSSTTTQVMLSFVIIFALLV